ncbi:hypothetical protein F5Y19DRAFT_468532 [Xylariaceae sp. FL1651]|nr:hypothetical protein F5Y19DRAFT_468532 [Xylariaceae sp. FL1651]
MKCTTVGWDDVDKFEDSQKNWDDYPLNLIRRESFRHTLLRYQEQLRRERVFHSRQSLYLFDLATSSDHGFSGRKIDSDDILRIHLNTPSDPIWRFVFLQSPTSLDPLGCTQQQLSILLTHHQVMPTFLDFVMAFKIRQRPVAYAFFRRENYLDADSPKFNLPKRRRSGLQIQHAFNLLSVEKTTIPSEQNQWPLRQTALYHSFDIVSGQALFIVLKGNTNIAKRIKDEVTNHRDLQPSSLANTERSFIGALQAQLIVLEWCGESWAEYVDYFEDKAKAKSTEAKHVPVSAGTSPTTLEMTFSRRSTVSPLASRQDTFARRSTLTSIRPATSQPAPPESSSQLLTNFKSVSQPESPVTPISSVRRTSSLRQSVVELFARLPGTRNKEQANLTMGLDEGESEGDNSIWFDLDKMLSFDEFQRINRWCDELEQSLMAIEQNKGVLKEVKNQYAEVLECSGVVTFNKSEVSSSLTAFFRRIDRVIRDLEINQDRLRAIFRTLENDKALYGAALQYQSAKVSEHFAHSARASSERMEDWTVKMHTIAVKTEHETVSMHVITVFTLIFLPGTFIATFFGSGVIQWNEDGDLGADYVVLSKGMALFWYVSIPILAVVLAVWALVYWVARRKRKSLNEQGANLSEKCPDNQAMIAYAINMPSQDTDPRPELAFADWARKEKTKHTGHDLMGEKQGYIPLPALREYWMPQQISAILRSFDTPLTVDITTIRDNYLRIFSVVVMTSMTRPFLETFIKHGLEDTCWPMNYCPSEYPWLESGDYKEKFKDILEKQWTFFPLVLRRSKLNDRILHDKQILPFVSCECIPHSGSAIILKVEVSDHLNNLVPSGQDAERNFFVLKKYNLKSQRKAYVTEVEALTLFRNSPSQNLITYYGSFRNDIAGYLLLEYVDQGNLEEFFSSKAHPQTYKDVEIFWTSLSWTLSGLDRIHQLMTATDYVMQGIHQDLKPSNILVCKGPSDSPYDFVPKIADFGLFNHARKVKSSRGEAKGFNKRGDLTYSAPEVSHDNRHKKKAGSFITTGADIFSLGAIFSTAAAWVMGGHQAKVDYFRQRRRHHSTLQTFRNTGYEGCFHNGIESLSIVYEMHKSISDHCNEHGWDTLTPQVVEVIQNRMLLPKSQDRETADTLTERFNQLLSHNPLTPISTCRQASWATNRTNSSRGNLERPEGIKKIKEFIEKSQNGQIIDPAVKELLDHIESNLRDRDQFFFIDDSTSMEQHKDLVLMAFKALSFIAKRLDPNKVELAFASEPKRVKRARDTKRLVKFVEKHEYRHNPFMMEHSLEELFEKHIIKRLPIRKWGFNLNPISRKHMSLYIFTDGNWGDAKKGACGVETPVKSLIDEVRHRKLARNQVSLHIVRFGDNENGKRHLDYLDTFGEEEKW